MPKPKGTLIHESTGSVFADLGLPDPDERLANAGIARQLLGVLRDTGAGSSRSERLGLSEEDTAALVSGRLSRFSVPQLEALLARLAGEQSTQKSYFRSPAAQPGTRLRLDGYRI